jgi:hypothetical protein
LVANSERQLHSVLATLEQCRTVLHTAAARETALLVSVAILQLRMKLNRIADSELKALCDAMTEDGAPAEKPQRPASPQARPLSALLKLVD